MKTFKIIAFTLWAIFFQAIKAEDQVPAQLLKYFIHPPVTKDHALQKALYLKVRNFLTAKKLHLVASEKIIPILEKSEGINKKTLKAIRTQTLADHIIYLEMKRLLSNQTYLSLVIYKHTGEKIFRKTINQAINLKVATRKLFGWLEDYFHDLPETGKIVKVDKRTIYTKFPLDYHSEQHVGKHFKIYCLTKACKRINHFELRGIFHKAVDGVLIGHLYNDNKVFEDYGNYKDMGVTLLNIKKNSSKMDLIETEKRIDFSTHYQYSLRACAIFPFIGDHPDQNLIREQFLKKVENGKWCYLRNDKKFFDILGKYGSNLDQYLQTPDVLRTISKKLSAGTMIKVNIEKMALGTRLNLIVYGENGFNVYFKRAEILNKSTPEYITDVLFKWLLQYVHQMPMDAVVVESIEGSVLIDLGKKAIHRNEQYFEIYRPTKIVQIQQGEDFSVRWEKMVIGGGILSEIKESGSIGRILKLYSEEIPIKKGDWVQLTGHDRLKDIKPVYVKHNIKNNRKLVRGKIAGDLTAIASSSTTKTVPSLFLGADIFLPFGFVGIIESERSFSNISKFDLANNNFKAGLGYSFMLEGNLFISLIDVYAGHMHRKLDIGSLGILGVGDITYRGFFAGMRLEMPVYEQTHFYAGAYASPKFDAENTQTLLGPHKNTFYLTIFGSLDYKHSRRTSYFAELYREDFRTTFTVDDTSVNTSTTKMKLGMLYNF